MALFKAKTLKGEPVILEVTGASIYSVDKDQYAVIKADGESQVYHGPFSYIELLEPGDSIVEFLNS